MTQSPIEQAIEKAIDFLEDYEAGRDPSSYKALLALEALRQHREGWRPIDENTPHATDLILGWVDKMNGLWMVESGCASYGERIGGHSNRWLHGQATHWMPLPPPPAEGE